MGPWICLAVAAATFLLLTWVVLRSGTNPEENPQSCPQCLGLGFLEDHGFGWEPMQTAVENSHDLVTFKACPGCSS